MRCIPKVTALNENVDTTIGSNKIFTNEIDAHIEDDICITSELKANMGVHWTGFTVKSNFYNAFRPRVAFQSCVRTNKVQIITARLTGRAVVYIYQYR